MALYIITNGGQEKIWYLGETLPHPFDTDALCIVEQVAYIQSDGDELEHIKFLFRKWNAKDQFFIPIPNGKRVIKWSGDIAKTILLNL